MSDLIDRQAAIAEFSCCELTPDGGIDANYAIDFLTQLPSAQPERRWIPCSERLPERIINGDVETVQEFFVTVKERWPGEEWKYHTDVAEFPGDYIDDAWQTYNDLGIIVDAKAEPRKKGKWVLDNLNDGNGLVYHCTCCNWLARHDKYAFCPNCGADMRGAK